MRICVVSDLHYKYAPDLPDEIEQNLRILAFLSTLPGNYDLLVLNGDIFDLWYDWRSVIVKSYFPILKLLADLRDSGCRIVYISGNHDFWFNDFFPEYLQVELQPDYYVTEADQKKLYFTHGDLHTANDLRYHILRRTIRLPFAKKLFDIFHPDFALMIGKTMSRSSRLRRVSHALQEKKRAGMEVYAQSLMPAYDYVLMGHSHEPCRIPMQHGIYLNSGDWVKHSTYISIIDGKAEINTYQYLK